MRKYEDVGQAIAYDDGVADGMLRGDEAWKVAQLAATIYAGSFATALGKDIDTEAAVRLAQKILAAAREAVRQ